MNIEYINFWRGFLITVCVSFLPSLVLLRFFYKYDKNPEPRKVLLKTFSLGFVIAIPVLIITYPLAPVVYKISNPMLAGMYWSIFCAAIPEEFFKFLVLTKYSLKHPAFDEPIDGIIYGVTVSLGFATVESMMHISKFGVAVAIPRALTAVPAHACFGVIMGYFVSVARFNLRSGIKIWFGLLVAVFIHALYDYPLVVNQIWKLNPDEPVELAVKLGFFVLLVIVFSVEILWSLRLVKQIKSMGKVTEVI